MDDHIKTTIDVYNKIAPSYSIKVESYAPYLEREKFIGLLSKGASILDAGCGPGRDSKYFFQHGFDVTGIDLSEKLLAIAKKKIPQVTFKKQDLRELHFPARLFDGIWACASLHHLSRSDMPRVLKKFFQLLKRNGVLFILVKEGTGEADIVESLSSGLPRHFVYYSLEELRKLLKDAGFKVDDMYTWTEESRRFERSNLVWVSCFAKKQ